MHLEAPDPDVLQRQVSRAGIGRSIIQIIHRHLGNREQTRVSCARPLQRGAVPLDGYWLKNDGRSGWPEWIVGVAVPQRVELISHILQHDRIPVAGRVRAPRLVSDIFPVEVLANGFVRAELGCINRFLQRTLAAGDSLGGRVYNDLRRAWPRDHHRDQDQGNS